jgi:predicted DNA-binding transcriptional regulator YafY
MARGDQLGRQWIIIQRLMGTAGGISARELAAEMGCHRRTVYRDLEALQVGGFPLYTEETDAGPRWKMLDAGRRAVPLPLDLTELMALYFSRRMLSSLHGGIFADAVTSLFDKIKSILPPKTHGYLDRLGGAVAVRESPRRSQGQTADVLAVIHRALDEGRCLEMTYRSRGRPRAGRRRVAPHKIWYTDDTFYMVGYCHLRKDVRVFAMDRIADASISAEAAAVPDGADLDGPMAAGLGAYAGVPEPVVIRFSPPAADYIAERIWHPSQRITREKGGHLIFAAELAVNAELMGFVLRWGAAAEVLAPEGFRRRAAAEIVAMGRRYETP